MSKRDDGDLAFPIHGRLSDNQFNGMSLRDYFAAKAMHGILAGDHPITRDPEPLPVVASVAYRMADAMLKARAE